MASEMKEEHKRHGEGEYEVSLSLCTSQGLMLQLQSVAGRFAAFDGYVRLPDGSETSAETANLIRSVGDRIIAVEGVSTIGKTYEDVVDMLMACGEATVSVRLVEARHWLTWRMLHPAMPTEKAKATRKRTTTSKRKRVGLLEAAVGGEAKLKQDIEEEGEYEVSIPITSQGLMLKVVDLDDGEFAAFDGYRRFAGGSMGPAEIDDLVRSVGDRIVAVDGVSALGKNFDEVIGMLTEGLVEVEGHMRAALSIRLVESKAWDSWCSVHSLTQAAGCSVEKSSKENKRTRNDAPETMESLADANEGSCDVGAADPEESPVNTTNEAETHKLVSQSPAVKTHPKTTIQHEEKGSQYEVPVPIAWIGRSKGLMLKLVAVEDGKFAAFDGYVRHADGSMGPAEVDGSIRSVGDIIVAVDGVSTNGKDFEGVVDMVTEALKEADSRTTVSVSFERPCDMSSLAPNEEGGASDVQRSDEQQAIDDDSPPPAEKLTQINPVFDPRHENSAEAQKKYPLLASLGIPLGKTKWDRNARSKVLGDLLQFNEEHDFLPHAYAHSPDGFAIKIPTMKKPNLSNFKSSNRRLKFMDHLMSKLTPTMQESAELICSFFARDYTDAFAKSMDYVKEIKDAEERKYLCSRERWLLEAPPDLVMHDGGSRVDPADVKWNTMFESMCRYQSEHGDCLVRTKITLPADHDSRTKDGVESYPWGHGPEGRQQAMLSRWVARMRTAKKENAPILTEKRIELLDSIGFTWEVEPDKYSAVEDGRMHRAVAAKLRYGLTAREAMLLGGFDEEQASNRTMKGGVNHRVCKWSKMKHKSKTRLAVEEILSRLSSSPESIEDERILKVFGDTDICASFMAEKKLIPNRREEANTQS